MTLAFNPSSSKSLKFDIKYFENGDRYDNTINGSGLSICTMCLDLG